MNKQFEDPCEETKKSCIWVNEDVEDEEGNFMYSDTYCYNCFRSRDWEKEEFQEK